MTSAVAFVTEARQIAIAGVPLRAALSAVFFAYGLDPQTIEVNDASDGASLVRCGMPAIH